MKIKESVGRRFHNLKSSKIIGHPKLEHEQIKSDERVYYFLFIYL